MKNAIEIKNLCKIYTRGGRREEVEALSAIDLEIPRGSIFGLLGPNGAGKSTIINIMAGLVLKTSGQVTVWGYDIDDNQRNAKASIGVVPQELNYDAFFTPLRTLELQAGLYGVPKNERRSREILEIVGLADKANSFVRSLSGGMKRRLLMAKAMVHSPPILVLDEPTAGVDVELRRQLWENVRKLNRSGVTILLTTHYLEEAEELCDRIAIINHGHIIANDDKRRLIEKIDLKEIRFLLNRTIDSIPKGLEKYSAEIDFPRTLIIRYRPSEQIVGEIISTLNASGFGVLDITTKESTLEDVFLQMTGFG